MKTQFSFGLALSIIFQGWFAWSYNVNSVFEAKETVSHPNINVAIKPGEKLVLVNITSELNQEVLTFRAGSKNGETVGQSFSILESEFSEKIERSLSLSQIPIDSVLSRAAQEDVVKLKEIISTPPESSVDVEIFGQTGLQKVSAVKGSVGPSVSAGFNVACNKFMTPTGQLGPLGKLFINNIQTKKIGIRNQYIKLEEIYLRNESLARDLNEPGACPNFINMDRKQRLQFWAYFAASLAMAESTCGMFNYGRNGSLVPTGMMQIAASELERISYGCGAFEPTNDSENVTCSQIILGSQLYRFNMLVACPSYFAPLRPNSGFDGARRCSTRTDGWSAKMARLLKSYAPCKPQGPSA